ncbi:MAG: hypothetical protein HZA89_18570 [Verrucomicrobia bacterium]|nr:hypothetical protein [Verrucomicrobiota bacterium]
MRLFEAILAANHRAAAGDATAGLRPGEFPDALPVVALTCIDPRLNPLIPEVLGVPEERFIWLRNAGNIIFDPMSSMTRTLALACAVKGGREIAVIGHTDCLVFKTSVLNIMERFKDLGVDRAKLPDNLVEFFGLTASERNNVLKACSIIRSSPLIGPRVPVHGLLVDIQTGKLEWLVNGYQALDAVTSLAPAPTVGHTVSASPPMAEAVFAEFKPSETKTPEAKIGAGNLDTTKWMAELQARLYRQPPVEAKTGTPPPLVDERTPPPKLPLPPPIRPRPSLQRPKH